MNTPEPSITYGAGLFDHVNHLAALSLSAEAFGRYRGYREWLIADGNGGEQIVEILAMYVWDMCECPIARALH
jgi:hypothetical protein